MASSILACFGFLQLWFVNFFILKLLIINIIMEMSFHSFLLFKNKIFVLFDHVDFRMSTEKTTLKV